MLTDLTETFFAAFIGLLRALRLQRSQTHGDDVSHFCKLSPTVSSHLGSEIGG